MPAACTANELSDASSAICPTRRSKTTGTSSAKAFIDVRLFVARGRPVDFCRQLDSTRRARLCAASPPRPSVSFVHPGELGRMHQWRRKGAAQQASKLRRAGWGRYSAGPRQNAACDAAPLRRLLMQTMLTDAQDIGLCSRLPWLRDRENGRVPCVGCATHLCVCCTAALRLLSHETMVVHKP